MIRLYPLTHRHLGGGEPLTQIMEKMKTKQTKIDRSAAKWLPGAMALAATTASSQAATVQITLTGNKISSTGGNQLVADLTGDNIDDVEFGRARFYKSSVEVEVGPAGGPLGDFVYALSSGTSFYVEARFDRAGGGVGRGYSNGEGGQATSYLNPITFTDSRINGGAPTEGWLQVNAFNNISADHTVELSRLIFDDASTTRPAFATLPDPQTEWGGVPEPSVLGLLALGAGGLLLRRSRAKAAA